MAGGGQWFYDCAGLATYVIWTCKNPDWNARKSQRRRLILMECGKNLVDIVLQKRAASPPQSLPYTVRKAIEQIGTATSTERSEASKDEKHIYGRCVFCGRKRDKKILKSKKMWNIDFLLNTFSILFMLKL
ncbi:conserved hypothetical protein [Trichinella spiralis]|uniref:hypothetical protein n=1 Tax=Trichinella spiralis TaxID=6334 RepID=UPI0001EFEB80|nr:conserved hypothetical protein [Trichinella spiralis]